MRTLTGRTVLSFLYAFSTALPLPAAQAKGRKPPKRPETPFTIWVHAEPRGEVDIEEKILRARDEFKESIDRRDDWFLRVEDRYNAEVIVEVKALFAADENRSDSRTSVMGANSHTSDYLVAGSRYYFFAVVTLFGNVVELLALTQLGDVPLHVLRRPPSSVRDDGELQELESELGEERQCVSRDRLHVVLPAGMTKEATLFRMRTRSRMVKE